MAHYVVRTPAHRGATRSSLTGSLLAAALALVTLVGHAHAFPQQNTTPQSQVRAVQEADANLAKALAERERLTEQYKNGIVSDSELIEADLRVTEARFRQAVARDKDTDAVAALEAVIPLRERQLKKLQEMQQAGVVGGAEINQSRIALAQARVRVGLYTLIVLRKEELKRAQDAYTAGVLSRPELEAAEKELETARKRLAEADTSATPTPKAER